MLTRSILVICFAFIIACSAPVKESGNEQSPANNEVVKPDGVIIDPQSEADTLKGSLKAYATSKIGNTTFTISYYSPATRGRMIWGGLVAYDNVWVTGAHKATSIEFDTSIKIGETAIPDGKYAFFTIPGKDSWTVILNKNWNQHLADDYDQANDILRLSVSPEVATTHQERLRYTIEEASASSGRVVMTWDKLRISVPFEIAN